MPGARLGRVLAEDLGPECAVGWGLSGICPGAAYASLGVGNWPLLWAIDGMFPRPHAQGYALRAHPTPRRERGARRC